ncbi:SH3 domain-containing protein 19-like [Haliotis cracherodii]|uniref:SH3 domain-containing protein 19-like n=1 Tax=Haliotis cracherodii TaxID=6455 RepID=UPI0039E90F5C
MAETVAGGGAPLPPKRPTIIRPSTAACTNGNEPKRPVPSRPAPARPPPSPKGGGDGARPSPLVPSRPPPKPSDGSGESRRPAVPPASASKIPPRPSAEKPNISRGSVKKRPEITIVSAKPMSQVGFRDEKESPKPEVKPADNSVSRPPPRPVSSSHAAEQGNNAPMRPRPPTNQIRPPPPKKSSTSSQPCHQQNLLDDDTEQSGLPPPMALFNPSPGSLVNLEGEHPPAPPPRTDLLGDTSLPSSHPVPSSRPPPPTRPGFVRHDDKPPIPARGAPMDLSPTDVVPRGVPPIHGSDGGDEDISRSQPPKPSKPTIIRPTKPLPSPREENKSISSRPVVPSKNAAQESKSGVEQSVIQKSDSSNSLANEPEPQYARIDKPKPRPNIIGRPKRDPDLNESDAGQGLPFKVKLRSTVQTSNENLSEEHREACPPVPPKLYVEGGQPSPTKPRPTVLPRPKPSPDIEEKKIVGDDCRDDKMQAPPPQPAAKRPTIIRPPPKPKRLHESEGTTDEDSKDKDADVMMGNMPPVPAKRPSSVVGLSSEVSRKDPKQDGSTSPRPVPAKRPVSIAARFEQQVDNEKQPVPVKRPPLPRKSSSGSPREDSESGRSGTEEEASPKHVPLKPRAKRRSVPGDSSSPDDKSPRDPPSVRPAASPEGTPAVSRPPPPRRQSDNYDEGVSRPPPPRPSGRPISMTTSKPEAAEDEDVSPKVRPPRPAGRPMSMMTPKKTEEVSADVEEESPKDKPPRPAGRPMSMKGKKSTSDETSKEEDEDSPKAKPLRPSGPPQGRQLAEEKGEKVEMSPSRPQGGPPRPMSMPAKPPPPTGGSPRSKKLPVKPSPPKAGARTPDLPPRPGPDHVLYHYTLSVPHAIATFDYEASQVDEISFKTEDVVMLVRRVDADWLVGRVGAKEGMFPAGFVDIVHPLHDEISDFAIKPDLPLWDSPLPVKKSTPSVTSGPRCVARFDFDGEGKDDLVFEEGDVIRLVGRVGSEWLKGELRDRVGIFPISFVEIVEDLPAEDTVSKSQDGHVTAMFDFDGQGDELSFQAGQRLQVVSQVNTEWLFGQMDGRTGKFPSAFIDYIPSDLPQYQAANEIEAQSHDPWSANQMTDDSNDDSHNKPITEPGSAVTDQSQPYCVASFDYEGEQDTDLSFKTGETIQLLEKIGSDWLRGRCHGKEGMFPASFVTIEKDLPEAEAVPHGEPTSHIPAESKPLIQARALYDFQGESDQELSFKVGDVILLGGDVAGSPDWRYGDLDGRSGMFPAAFVEVIS